MAGALVESQCVDRVRSRDLVDEIGSVDVARTETVA
jgi:hypothetical protein